MHPRDAKDRTQGRRVGFGSGHRRPMRHAGTAAAAGAAALVLCLSACAGQPSAAATPASTGSSGQLTVVTEPQQGLAPLYRLITGARSNVDMTMYELRDMTAEQDLAADAARGVRVRVVLDTNRERSSNQAAYAYLSAHGVDVVWAAADYAATHQKTITVDDRVAAVMTLNMVTRDYSSTRDVLVVDSHSADVAAIEHVFDADFNHTAVAPGDGDDLVWSPTDSQPDLLALINGAQHSLAVENEEMSSSAIVSALEAAARRGVKVSVTMTDSSTYSREFNSLTGAGVQVRTYSPSAPLYIHAKIVLADYGTGSAKAFIGSQNFTVASLRRNRELGVITTQTSVLDALHPTLASDFGNASAWT